MEGQLEKIPCSSITEGVVFSAPVFFDDGENMFLAPGHTAKKYHVAVLRRWSVPFLLSSGSLVSSEGVAAAPAEELSSQDDSLEEAEAVDEVGELEELSEFEDL